MQRPPEPAGQTTPVAQKPEACDLELIHKLTKNTPGRKIHAECRDVAVLGVRRRAEGRQQGQAHGWASQDSGGQICKQKRNNLFSYTLIEQEKGNTSPLVTHSGSGGREAESPMRGPESMHG